FADVFSKKVAEVLPPHRPYDCAIDLLPNAKLPKSRLYSLSRPETQAMAEYIQENLAKGFIRPSQSPVGSGFFFVGKKDGSLRPCIDFRELNRITIKNSYPLPLISVLFDQLRTATIFSKIDLRGAYNLIRIREGDEWKTAFNTHSGHYEYLVMPFGLCNAPAVFQDFMNDVLREYLDRFLVVYLDDILIFSHSLEEHQKHVRLVLQKLRDHRLGAKLEKCEFEVQQIAFLGYIISPEGFQMEGSKVQAVLDWVQPTSLKALQRFLGFANFYRRFIAGFSSIVAPLVALTKKGADVAHWSCEAKAAFAHLKRAFVSAKVLRHPDPERPFVVEVDASEMGIGAVLSQMGVSDNRLHPCAYFSRKFSPAEMNYDVGNRELLAIKDALEEWRHWLEGAKFVVSILTDHKNLAYLESAKHLNARQARWALFFARFNFLITYRPGSKNIKADALFLEFHAKKSAGHPGIARTRELLSRAVWWPSVAKDVDQWVRACDICARNKTPRGVPVGPLHPLSIPSKPWTHISMDFVVDLPKSSGMTAIWVVVDRFSKMAHFVPLVGLPSARRLSELFMLHVVRLHGLPLDVVSDRGSQFVAKFWRAFCSDLQISVSLSSGYHPQSNGQTERVNQSLEQFLRCYVSKCQTDWVAHLSMAECAYNNAAHSATGISPFLCVYGHHPNCSQKEDQDSQLKLYAERFKEREYPEDVIEKALVKTRITHKPPRKIEAEGVERSITVPFITTYNCHEKIIRQSLNKHWNILMMDPVLRKVLPPKPQVVFRKTSSLKEILAPSLLKSTTSIQSKPCQGCYKCGSCNICKLVHRNRKKFSNNDNSREYTIKHFINCNSLMVIYLLECPCGLKYVGKTKRVLKLRIQEHARNIKNKITTHAIYRHFHEFHHSNPEDMTFKGIEIVNLGERGGDILNKLSKREMFWIFELKTMAPLGFNEGFEIAPFL
ncbi:uncharacterized protein LOC134932160, partial [Pseudophryne corroboree]|uniref:uncharacterized protein LOC134932160 n=1 Tax=Pseudophryne corroboree TaxID=495146 RepID=UPI003081FAF7